MFVNGEAMVCVLIGGGTSVCSDLVYMYDYLIYQLRIK